MTRHELASFALKLLGIYALVKSLPLIQFLGGALAMLGSDQGRDMVHFWTIVGMFIPFLLMALVGVLLLIFSKALAPLLMGTDGPLGISSALTGEDVQAIGFSVAAVLIVLEAIPRLAQVIANWSYLASRSPLEPVSTQVARGLWQSALSAGIQLALAVLLFLRARGLSNLWRRLQAGQYVRVDESGTRSPGGPNA